MLEGSKKFSACLILMHANNGRFAPWFHFKNLSAPPPSTGDIAS